MMILLKYFVKLPVDAKEALSPAALPKKRRANWRCFVPASVALT
jgi:hypothetical protein